MMDTLDTLSLAFRQALPAGTMIDSDGDFWPPSADGFYRGYVSRGTYETLVADKVEEIVARTDATYGRGRTRLDLEQNFSAQVIVPDLPEWERDLLQQSDADKIAVLEAKIARQADVLEQFKRTVVERAMRAAEEHDWCSVVTRTLEEMGLGEYIPKATRQVEVTVTYTVDVEMLDRDNIHHFADGGDDWLRQSFQVPELEGDSDIEVTERSSHVSSVRVLD